jgi:hypothetical protein
MYRTELHCTLPFSIVNYPHLDGDVPHATSYGVYISQLVRFARPCILTSEIFSLPVSYSNRATAIINYVNILQNFTIVTLIYIVISKFNSDLRSFLRQGNGQPDFYGYVVYKLRQILGHCNFSDVFTKIINRFIKRVYDPTIFVIPHAWC